MLSFGSQHSLIIEEGDQTEFPYSDHPVLVDILGYLLEIVYDNAGSVVVLFEFVDQFPELVLVADTSEGENGLSVGV